MGAQYEQVNQDLEGGGSREWRHSGVSYGMKKITTEFVSSSG